MKKRLFSAKGLLSISLAGILTGYVGNAMASGFQLFEENGVGTGDYDAGGAAIAEDASTAFFNPAGLTRIDHQQLVMGVDGVFTSNEFHGSSAWNTNVLNPLLPKPTPLLPAVTFTGSANGGRDAAIPSFYYSIPLNPAVVFGVGVTAPFGLATEYSDNSIAAYTATESQLTVIDFIPAIGVKLTDQWSVGAGADIDRLNATLSSIAGLPSLATAQGLLYNAYDTESENTASDWGWGYHVGVLFQPQADPGGRFGLTYHSQVDFEPSGNSTFNGPLAGVPAPTPYTNPEISNNGAATSITLPAFTMLSAFQNITPIWAVMGSVTYTQWDVFKNLTLSNVEAVAPDLVTGGFDPTQISVSLPQNFRNTWRFAVGSSVAVTNQWLLRAGVGYDENPTNDEDRNLRLPDSNRVAVAIGTHYQMSPCIGVDLGYTHLFIRDASINNAVVFGPQTIVTSGSVNSYANVVGAQVTWDII